MLSMFCFGSDIERWPTLGTFIHLFIMCHFDMAISMCHNYRSIWMAFQSTFQVWHIIRAEPMLNLHILYEWKVSDV